MKNISIIHVIFVVLFAIVITNYITLNFCYEKINEQQKTIESQAHQIFNLNFELQKTIKK